MPTLPRPLSHAPCAAATRGLSLVELLIVLAVVLVVAGSALPAFQAAAARRHLEGATAQLETEIQYARSSAVMLNRGVRLSFSGDAGASCYVIHTGPAGACTCTDGGAARCEAGAESLRSVRYEAAGPVSVRSNSRSMVFEPTRGTVTPTATIVLENRRGEAMHLVVNLMGRARACTPTPPLPGVRSC